MEQDARTASARRVQHILDLIDDALGDVPGPETRVVAGSVICKNQKQCPGSCNMC